MRFSGENFDAKSVQRALTGLALALTLTLSGCLTTSGGGPGPGPITTLPKPPPVVRGMAGGLAGTSVGKDLSASDLRKALDAEYKALEYTQAGQVVSWTGDAPGTSGQVAPNQPYRVGSQDCRQYSHTILSGGGSQTARGTACRNADGSWTPLT